MLRRHAAAAALIGGSMLAGGALGAAVFVPHLAGAQTTPSTQTPSTSHDNAGRGHAGCHHGRNSGQSGTTAPGPSSSSY